MRKSRQSRFPAAAFYLTVWRWHFCAGIMVAPFVIFLAITGSIYLWKPQYENWRYHDLFNVPTGTATVSVDAQMKAAQAVMPPGWRAQTFQPAFAAGSTSQVAFAATGKNAPAKFVRTVFVDPSTGRVMGQLDDRTRFMRIMHDLHGTLLLGDTGGYVIEFAAGWALVLLLTGLYLWWPRPKFAVWGFLLPRLRAKGRTFWRDVHAVPAVWLAASTLFLLSTGMLWTNAAGGWYRTISAALGQGTPRESDAGAHRSALTGWSPPLKSGLAEKIDALSSTMPGHEGQHMGVAVPDMGPGENALPLDRVIAIANVQHVPQPYAIALPVGPLGFYSILSDRNQAFNRTYLHLDQYSGRILADVRFKDFGYLAQFMLWAIIAHEGQLFGVINQILGTIAAGGVLLLGISGLMMWWQRRPMDRFFAPTSDAPLPRVVFVGMIVLGCLLPLLGASLILGWLVERLVFRRTAADA
ncbi:MAG TPA: PepSY domain-containing protein [Lacunisphaera sp.]|jgi:uncharacterized iron-regulated membrane protein